MAQLFQKDFGKYGSISAEIKEGGHVDLKYSGDIIEAARELTKKTATLIDDKLVAFVGTAVGHKEEVEAEVKEQA